MEQLNLPLFEENPLYSLAGSTIDWVSLCQSKKRSYEIPSCVDAIMKDPDCVSILSISGGKDSQASQEFLLHLRKTNGWVNELYAVHCDLGRADWKFTLPFVKAQCEKAGLPLVVVKADLDLLAIIYKRYLRLKEQNRQVPHFPSAAARYCTKMSKTEPTDKHLRAAGHRLIVNVMGIRAEESTNRAKKPVISLRPSLCSERFAVKFCDLETKKVKKYWLLVEEAYRLWLETGKKHRLAIDWLIIHKWKIEQVWEWCGTSLAEWERRRKLPDSEALDGWPASPIYVIGINGNERKSCAYCILASENDLVNAIAYNPETFDWFAKNEQESGWDFQENKPLRRFAKYRVELIKGLSQEETEILIFLYQKAMTEIEIEEFMPRSECCNAMRLLRSKQLIVWDEGKYRINFEFLETEVNSTGQVAV